MNILETKPLYHAKAGKRTFLTMHERRFEHKGKESRYFFVGRGEEVASPEAKRPDAVIIVGMLENPGEERRLVLTSEYRVPLGAREISFPAGLIDSKDYDGVGNIQSAAIRAAKREFMEEVGLNLQVTDVSPPNLYSSAGMTNESCCIVFGTATGTPHTDGNEHGEDIEILLLTGLDIGKLVVAPDPTLNFSKVVWPFLWFYNRSKL